VLAQKVKRMARRRRKVRKHYAKRPKARAFRKAAQSSAMAAGLAYGGYKLLSERTPKPYTYTTSTGATSTELTNQPPLRWFASDLASWPLSVKVRNALKAAGYQATNMGIYVPLVAGAVAHKSKSLPLVSIVARPVDKMLKKSTRGKWGL